LFRSADAITTTSSSTTTTTTTTVPVTPTECGDADTNGEVTVVDALVILLAAVGGAPCEPCRCDSDGSATIAATDALRVLSLAIGIDEELACPPCD
jgi:hypothetical protein